MTAKIFKMEVLPRELHELAKACKSIADEEYNDRPEVQAVGNPYLAFWPGCEDVITYRIICEVYFATGEEQGCRYLHFGLDGSRHEETVCIL